MVTNLENLVEFLRGQLRLANEDNLRNHQQLQDLLQEHQQLIEQHDLDEAARTVAGNFYMDRQLVLRNADQERERQEQQIQMAINQRINQLLNRDVFFTPRGECKSEITLHRVWSTCMSSLCSCPTSPTRGTRWLNHLLPGVFF